LIPGLGAWSLFILSKVALYGVKIAAYAVTHRRVWVRA
jgi:hypothetical protein